MNDPNLSLLTQNEVDTLVNFLVDKKNNMNSNVLNQESIDKLIGLIRKNELNKLNLNAEESSTDLASSNLSKLNIQDNPNQLCELRFQINDQSGYLEFYATNTVTGKEQIITPTIYDKATVIKDNTEWGYAVAPFVLDRISVLFNLKYSRKTYDDLCKLYALKNYGMEDKVLYNIFIPESEQLENHIIQLFHIK